MDFYEIITWAVIIYAVIYTGTKVIFSVVSLAQIRAYTKKYPHISTEEEVRSIVKTKGRSLPLISVIAPAYNEGPIIVESVKSFLNQSYPNTEVIVSSDGGTDDTLDQLIQYFELFEVDFKGKESENIFHQPVKRYFKSKRFDITTCASKPNTTPQSPQITCHQDSIPLQ